MADQKTTSEPATPVVSKAGAAYEYIKARIADGTYFPGYRLVLADIAQKVGTSVAPIREAIRKLEAEGLVTIVKNVGAQVATFDPVAYRETIESLALLEGYAIAAAVPHMTPDDIAAAYQINADIDATLRDFDPASFSRRNYEFHHALFRLCPNAYLLEQVEWAWNRLAVIRKAGFTFAPGRAHETIHEHDGILKLIEAGADPREIEVAAREHRFNGLLAYAGEQTSDH